MKERPILFSGAMIRAIREGRKSQTRRIVKQVPHWQHCGKDIMDWGLSGCYTDDEGRHWLDIQTEVDDNSHDEIQCPYGKPGDRLWVRETWRMDAYNIAAEYRATTSALMEHVAPWKPSIFMPRWASRITLEIVSVRVERLQDISILDSYAEGVGGTYGETGIIVGFPGLNYEWDNKNAIEQYQWLWESIHGPGSWDANPWVWAVEFKEVTR